MARFVFKKRGNYLQMPESRLHMDRPGQSKAQKRGGNNVQKNYRSSSGIHLFRVVFLLTSVAVLAKARPIDDVVVPRENDIVAFGNLPPQRITTSLKFAEVGKDKSLIRVRRSESGKLPTDYAKAVVKGRCQEISGGYRIKISKKTCKQASRQQYGQMADEIITILKVKDILRKHCEKVLRQVNGSALLTLEEVIEMDPTIDPC